MGWLLNLFKAVVTVTATVIGIAAVVTIEIVNAASEAWGDYEEKKRKERLPEAERVKEQARDALKDVNDELLSILDKFNRRGCWSSDEKRREEYLRQRRDELKRTIDGVDEILVAKEISKKLNLSTHTVYTHRKNIMEKLKFRRSSELVLFAVNKGLLL